MDDYEDIEINFDEVARLMRAVVKRNTYKRGKKMRQESWKVIAGVYLNYSYKSPQVTLKGRQWSMLFEFVGAKPEFDIYGYRKRIQGTPPAYVSIPHPQPVFAVSMQSKYHPARKERDEPFANSSVQLRLVDLTGVEAWKHDWTMLRLFESEWEEDAEVSGRRS